MGYFSKSNKPSRPLWTHGDHQAYRRKVLDEHKPVSVYHNNETGMWRYSVYIVGDNSYWINSFRREKTAIKYVRKVGYAWDGMVRTYGGCRVVQ